MKALALNSSARAGDVSKTEIMLNCLVKGMREKGAEVEVINLKKMKIRNCIGCFTCWTKTPGTCIHRDDMTNDIFPKYIDCDLCIMATPLFHFTVNARMKTFIERTLPILQPFFVKRDGVTAHPLRHKFPPTVILSVAGFPELSVFDQLRSYVNFLYRDYLVAEIYRPSAELMRAGGGKTTMDILDAVVQAGGELATAKQISPETLDKIQKETISFEKFALMGNLAWKTCIEEGVSMVEFEKKGMIPRPDSIETFLALMKYGFNPKKADGAKFIMQFNFTGQVEGNCCLSIENGAINASSGPAAMPDITINSPFDVWMDILTRKADGADMLMQGKYTVEGDADILLNMQDYFGG